MISADIHNRPLGFGESCRNSEFLQEKAKPRQPVTDEVFLLQHFNSIMQRKVNI